MPIDGTAKKLKLAYWQANHLIVCFAASVAITPLEPNTPMKESDLLPSHCHTQLHVKVRDRGPEGGVSAPNNGIALVNDLKEDASLLEALRVINIGFQGACSIMPKPVFLSLGDPALRVEMGRHA